MMHLPKIERLPVAGAPGSCSQVSTASPAGLNSGGGRPCPPSLWSCKPGFVSPCGAAVIRLGGGLPRRSSSLPGPLATHSQRDEQSLGPYLALLRRGFGLPRPSPAARWALTPPFHPYPNPFGLRPAVRVFGPSSRPGKQAGRSVLCATFPGCAFEAHPVAVSNPPALWSPDFPPALSGRRLPGPRG